MFGIYEYVCLYECSACVYVRTEEGAMYVLIVCLRGHVNNMVCLCLFI
jgi:hypothetical protein